MALAVALWLGACGTAARSPTVPAPSRSLLEQMRPLGRGTRFHPPAVGPVIGRCSAKLGSRTGVHLELFAQDRVILVPTGLGTRPPRALTSGRISAARCYGDLVTLEPTGVLLLRPGVSLRLADVFRSWGEPFSPTLLLSFRAAPATRVRAFIGGRLWHGRVTDVPLSSHAEIVLEVGPYVPPHSSYTFPPGS